MYRPSFDTLMTWMGLQLIPYVKVNNVIQDLEKTFYLKYAAVHIELEDNLTTDMVNSTMMTVHEDVDSTEEDKFQSLVVEGRFFTLSVIRGREESHFHAFIRCLPCMLWVLSSIGTTGRVIIVYARFFDDSSLTVYLVLFVTFQINGLITHCMFVYLGGSMRMNFIKTQFCNMFGGRRHLEAFENRIIFTVVQGCLIVYILFNILFFFYIRDSVVFSYNGSSIALWDLDIGRFWLKVYGVVSTTISGLLFWESMGSIWSFLHGSTVIFTNVYGSSSTSMSDYLAYKALFYKTKFIMSHISSFMSPQVNTSIFLDIIVIMYGMYAFAYFVADQPLMAYTFIFIYTGMACIHLIFTILMCVKINGVVNQAFDNVTVFKRLYLKEDVSKKLNMQMMNGIIHRSGIHILGLNMGPITCVAIGLFLAMVAIWVSINAHVM